MGYPTRLAARARPPCDPLCPRETVFMDGSGPTREGTVYAVVATALTAATLATVLRFYVRHTIIKRVGIDDWAVAVALVIPSKHVPLE